MSLWRMFLLGVCCLTIVEHPTVAGEIDTHDAKCHEVRAKIALVSVAENCASPVGLCTTGAVTGGGIVNGVFGGIALGFAPAAGLPNLVPNSTLSFVADHKIETPRGTLSMRGSGVFDTARGEYSEVDPITGGTGIFAGATGTLWLTGTSPDGGASFAGPLFGQVCLSR